MTGLDSACVWGGGLLERERERERESIWNIGRVEDRAGRVGGCVEREYHYILVRVAGERERKRSREKERESCLVGMVSGGERKRMREIHRGDSEEVYVQSLVDLSELNRCPKPRHHDMLLIYSIQYIHVTSIQHHI